MTRRTLAALAVVGALAGPAAAAPTVEQIAPGGNIRSVVDRTERVGWPHATSARERRDVAALVAALYAPAGPARTFCRFGATMGAPIGCKVTTPRAVVVVRIGLPERRNAAGRIIRRRIPGIWEDGSYRVTLATSATRTPTRAQETPR